MQLGAICTCTENIQVLEIQEFHLPAFALKMLHALKVWEKIRLAGKKHKRPRVEPNPCKNTKAEL